MKRPAYKIDAGCPGSDLAGGTAAALASASIISSRQILLTLKITGSCQAIV
ncbi:hypothetical protein PO124_00460 [Bacillus licheniformis]|nr:hypothetical protein [Bacillus licheniformis]